MSSARPASRARKRFGQHFLHDPAIIGRIVAAVDLLRDEAAVEIGPGRGALTPHLLESAGSLDAVEIDRDLAAELEARFGARPGWRLHTADALEMDFATLARARGRRLRIIGNLPYNISTPLLFHLLQSADAIIDMHFMLQLEVVDRIVAAPGSDAYGRLGVMLAPWVRASRLFQVGSGAFQPPPRVDSAVVRLSVEREPPDWARAPLFAPLVRAAFSQRRKTLRNALRAFLSAGQIAALGIDPGARAETLSPPQFGALAIAAGRASHVSIR